MATYNGNMSVSGRFAYADGSSYSSTAGGYQIGGEDGGSAFGTLELPSTYKSYESCSISCTLYASTDPSDWLSSWSCNLGIYKNGKLYGSSGLMEVTKSNFSAGNGASSRAFSVNLTGGYFEAGDEVEIAFYGDGGGYVDSSDRCLYLKSAKFTSTNATNTITLSFSANGGTGAPSSQTVEANSSGIASFTIPSTKPTRANYSFLGWATSANGSAAYAPGAIITLTEDQKLYAVWRLNATYTVTFDANGGSGEPGVMSDVSDANGESSFTIPDIIPTRAGYVFVGWDEDSSATEAAYTSGDIFTTTENTILYAIWNLGVSISVLKSDVLWTDCAYTVALYLNGIKQYTLTNDGTGVYVAQNVDPDTYDLYISGTDTGIDITLPFEDDADPIEVRYHTITYHANNSEGGTVPNDVNAYFDGASAPISDNVGGLVKTDYIFIGWNTSEDGTGTHYNVGDVISITSSLILYAIWREATKAYIFTGTEWLPGDPVMFNGEDWKTAKMCMYTTEWNS